MTGDPTVTGLRVRNVKTGIEQAINSGGMLEAIGHEHAASCSPGNSIPTQTATCWPTRTTLVNVFTCGDVVDYTYRQAVTAAGTDAAIDAERWLAAQRP